MEIDVQKRIIDVLQNAEIEKSTRDSVTLRFRNASEAEIFRALMLIAVQAG